MPTRITRRLKGRQRSVGKPRQKSTCVVDLHFLHFPTQLMLPLFHKSLGHRTDIFNIPIQPDRGVDAMRQQIPRHPTPRRLRIQSPKPRSTLRKVRINRPVLQKLRPIMKDFPQLPRVNDLFSQGHRGNPTVVVPNHIRHPSRLNNLHHLLPLLAIQGERLFTHHHLPRLRRRNRNLRVRIVRRTNVDQINVVPLN